MTEKTSGDINKYLPWLIVAGLGYMLWVKKPDDSPTPASVEKTTSQVFSEMRTSYGATFSEAATEVQNKRLQTDRQLLDFVKPKIEAARKEAQAPFDAMCERELPESFVGKEADVAALLRRIEKSW
jgi:hypothetical protein